MDSCQWGMMQCQFPRVSPGDAPVSSRRTSRQRPHLLDELASPRAEVMGNLPRRVLLVKPTHMLHGTMVDLPT